MVYLILNEEESVCKIGYSENPPARLAALQTGCPFSLRIVKSIEGELIREKELHDKFKKYKLQGEWFQYCDDIRIHFGVLSECFVSAYPEHLTFLARCTGAEQSVVLCTLQYLDYNTNEFILTPERRAAICACGEMKPDTVSSAISRLMKKNIILKKSGSTYILNPKIFFYGKELERAKVVEATIVYEIGGGRTKLNPLRRNKSFKLTSQMQPA